MSDSPVGFIFHFAVERRGGQICQYHCRFDFALYSRFRKLGNESPPAACPRAPARGQICDALRSEGVVERNPSPRGPVVN